MRLIKTFVISGIPLIFSLKALWFAEAKFYSRPTMAWLCRLEWLLVRGWISEVFEIYFPSTMQTVAKSLLTNYTSLFAPILVGRQSGIMHYQSRTFVPWVAVAVPTGIAVVSSTNLMFIAMPHQLAFAENTGELSILIATNASGDHAGRSFVFLFSSRWMLLPVMVFKLRTMLNTILVLCVQIFLMHRIKYPSLTWVTCHF